MKLKVYNDNGTITSHTINKDIFYNKKYSNKISYINSINKEENALNIFKSFFSDSKSILFDDTNNAIKRKIHSLNINEFNSISSKNNIFTPYDFSLMYFTSGTTGNPIAALKTKKNILSEIKVISKLLSKYNIKRVIVTVPFIHFYGSLMGLMYPYLNNIDIIIKEHFLPNNLLDLVDDYTLVVTTPLYIQSLNRLTQNKDLGKSLFLSSTSPLFNKTIIEFNKKYSSNIIQLFGSTETGGIAYKYNDDENWETLERVKISTNKDNELIVESPFVSNILFESDFKITNSKIQTFDFVEIKDNKFKLLGRSSQIIKIAGKRYSTIQIENILENIEGIQKALVLIKNKKDELRGESLIITIQSTKIYLIKDIKKILKEELSNIKFSIELKVVKEIKTTSLGKKILI